MQEVQEKMIEVKKVYAIACEIEVKWFGDKKKDSGELEYERDFNRVQMMNI